MADYSKLRGLLLAAAVVCIAVAMLLGWTPELDHPPHRYILVPPLTWTNRTWIFRLWVREKWVQPCTWLLVPVFDVFTYLWSSLLRLDAFFWARTIWTAIIVNCFYGSAYLQSWTRQRRTLGCGPYSITNVSSQRHGGLLRLHPEYTGRWRMYSRSWSISYATYCWLIKCRDRYLHKLAICVHHLRQYPY